MPWSSHGMTGEGAQGNGDGGVANDLRDNASLAGAFSPHSILSIVITGLDPVIHAATGPDPKAVTGVGKRNGCHGRAMA